MTSESGKIPEGLPEKYHKPYLYMKRIEVHPKLCTMAFQDLAALRLELYYMENMTDEEKVVSTLAHTLFMTGCKVKLLEAAVEDLEAENERLKKDKHILYLQLEDIQEQINSIHFDEREIVKVVGGGKGSVIARNCMWIRASDAQELIGKMNMFIGAKIAEVERLKALADKADGDCQKCAEDHHARTSTVANIGVSQGKLNPHLGAASKCPCQKCNHPQSKCWLSCPEYSAHLKAKALKGGDE